MDNERFLIKSILEDMSDGVIVVGFDGRIQQYNRAAKRILSLYDEQLRDKSIASIMNETDENDELFDLVTQAILSKEKVVRTIPYFRGEEMLYLRITADFLMNNSEKIGVIVQISDITENAMLFIANKRLANQVIDLMNSFVEVMVTAIDEESSYNANHTKSMVRYAERYLGWLEKQGELTEHTAENTAPLIMSVWLHDIGKLLVPQEIMDKPTRLGAAAAELSHRFEIARLVLKNESLTYPERKAELEGLAEQLREAEKLISSADTAGFLDEETISRLKAAARIECPLSDGSRRPLLSDKELEALTVVRGTLTSEERKIIESHVSWTGTLLSKMEFRGDYKKVPLWAAGHHELLDGSGYPERLSGEDIPWETRLITIIDIYDALTAEDRPYKPPMKPEKAFAVLDDMAEQGKIDKTILNSFRSSEAWKNERKDEI
ncbi:MAG: PAS domain S-box protein [Ruminococcus sp.]|nr:PAS domain S-box protein [Ruminococcus sp.]